MAKRHERSTRSPSIKELIEALAEEERRAAAPDASPLLRAPASGTRRHHAASDAAAANDVQTAHIYPMTLTANSNAWTANPQRPARTIDFEQGGGANVGPLDWTPDGAKVLRRAPQPPPLPEIAIDVEDARRDQQGESDDVALAIQTIDRQYASTPVQARIRLPGIAHHALAAAGALAVIMPCAYYLTAPVLDRVTHGHGAVREHVSTQPSASDNPPRADRFATATLGPMDRQEPPPSVPAPTLVRHGSHATGTPATPPDVTSAPNTTARQLQRLSSDFGHALTPERISALVARGRELASMRDITAARQYFLRAAQGGNAQAAFEAALTYDPNHLKNLGVIGLKADAQRAGELYRQADAGGIAGARELLARLAAYR